MLEEDVGPRRRLGAGRRHEGRLHGLHHDLHFSSDGVLSALLAMLSEVLVLLQVLVKTRAGLRLLPLSAGLFGFGGRRRRGARRTPLLEHAVDEGVGVLGVQAPEAALARLVLAPRHLEEALVEGQVVADRVLRGGEALGRGWLAG